METTKTRPTKSRARPSRNDALADYLPLQTIARKLGKSRKSVSRWVTRGVNGVRLDALVLGRGYVARMADVELFARRLTEARNALPKRHRIRIELD